MMLETRRSLACSHCQAGIRVPHEPQQGRVSCEQCGAEFVLDAQDRLVPTVRGPVRSNTEGGGHAVSDDPLAIGKLAVKFGYAPAERVQEAVTGFQRHQASDPSSDFGRFLVDGGVITQSQLRILWSLQDLKEARALDRKFGEMAIGAGLATSDQVEKALTEQNRIFTEHKSVALIGDILVNMGVMSDQDRDNLLAGQNRLKQSLAVEPEPVAAEPAPVEPAPTTLRNSGAPFIVSFSEDKLSAFIQPTADASSGTSPADIRRLLQSAGIRHGIADDDRIAKYLAHDPLIREPWRVARGTPSEAGRDPEIVYHFDTDPFRIGSVKEGGAIDFRDRGAIPQVKAGDLVAELIPGVEGTAGMDIFGRVIPAPKLSRIRLLCGEGAEKTADELKALAKIDGRPEVSADGKLFVFPYLQIMGDVGLETGHIDFDGRIEVRGAVTDGFRIRGGSLLAEEIQKADVETAGDIVVLGGILGARIKTDGNIRARYIRGGRIEAAGDIVVESEIYHSEIETSGACRVERGKVLGSWIAAYKGIEAVEIGSGAAKPCMLIVGVDPIVRRSIDGLRAQLTKKREEQDRIRPIHEEFRQELNKLNRDLEAAAKDCRTGIHQLKLLREKISASQEGMTAGMAGRAQEAVQYLREKIGHAQQKMTKAGQRRKLVREKMLLHQTSLQKLEQEIEGVIEEIDRIVERSQAGKRVPKVKVADIVYADTTVKGLHTALNLTDNYRSVVIREIQKTDSESRTIWEMEIAPLA